MLWILFLALAQRGAGNPEKRQADEQVDRQNLIIDNWDKTNIVLRTSGAQTMTTPDSSVCPTSSAQMNSQSRLTPRASLIQGLYKPHLLSWLGLVTLSVSEGVTKLCSELAKTSHQVV